MSLFLAQPLLSMISLGIDWNAAEILRIFILLKTFFSSSLIAIEKDIFIESTKFVQEIDIEFHWIILNAQL